MAAAFLLGGAAAARLLQCLLRKVPTPYRPFPVSSWVIPCQIAAPATPSLCPIDSQTPWASLNFSAGPIEVFLSPSVLVQGFAFLEKPFPAGPFLGVRGPCAPIRARAVRKMRTAHSTEQTYGFNVPTTRNRPFDRVPMCRPPAYRSDIPENYRSLDFRL